MRRIVSGGLATALALVGAASANPNGAPWGSADPSAAQNCASCHFDGEAKLSSELILLAGRPHQIAAGKSYTLQLIFGPCDERKAGFLLSASAGFFESTHDKTEAKDGEIRSLAPISAGDGGRWLMKWTAPMTVSKDVWFHAAVNCSNDDASPFGDEIHFKQFEVPSQH